MKSLMVRKDSPELSTESGRTNMSGKLCAKWREKGGGSASPNGGSVVLGIYPQSDSLSASKLLRYPLRSATKPKEEKPPLVDSSNSSAHKRGKLASSVRKVLVFLIRQEACQATKKAVCFFQANCQSCSKNYW
ncbi:putative muscle M-line assembly protein unc-89-like [Forsythia ovata]|uniref:Muscle M-line assembly protein unc-89-like n=1 Tax=Forsythia ovata TaxID=205694 RepID=A0ABD1PKL7_9LAMI